MAHRHETTAPLPSAFTSISSTLTASDKLLSSVLTLPANPCIVYATYSPSGTAPPYEILESARRQLVSRNQASTFQDSILPHVHIDRDMPTFHAFIVASDELLDNSLSVLKQLRFDDLIISETSSFTPHGVYPCSLTCADSRTPCASCLAHADLSSISTARLLPRKPLRQIYARFIDAVRTRLIDYVVNASLTSALRFHNGFLLVPNVISNEWGADWDHHAQLRPLVHCHLDFHLASNRLEVHSIFRPFPHVPLPALLPLPPGTPLTLLPTGAPAFFLANYSGPTASLTAHFTRSLAPHPLPRPKDPQYIIAWLAVQNKQGEDKGTPIIWPTALCLVSNSSSRKPLAHIPELPAQLQPSPPPPPPPSINVGTPHVDSPSTPLRVLTNHPLTRRPATASPSPLRALRTLTLSHTPSLQNVASEVGSYVESVVRERDRERERIRREREAMASVSASPQVVTPAAAAVSTVPTPVPDTNLPLHPPPPAPTEQPPIHPSVYYPSPATAIDPPAPPGPPSVSELSIPLPQTNHAPAPPSFDPFNSMDTTWSQPTSDFMDYDMGPAGQRRIDVDFADYDTFTFTDDDFSFFDRPSRPSDAAPAPLALSPSIFGVADVGVSFTPAAGTQLSPDVLTFTPAPAPALPSPTTSSSAPSTPHVKVTHPPSQFARTFDPVAFAPSHSLADAKYSSAGKFALPSPPDEEDRTSPLPDQRSQSYSTASPADLRARYSAATDPRISIVRQLIGVKRKSKSLDHGRARCRQFLLSSYDDSVHEDTIPPLEDDEKSEAISEDDADMDDERERSTTPPPSYLPLGPMLLHTQFHHALLLPLCQPLRPPGSAVAPMSLVLPPPPAAAHTPVSPAASLEKINQELAAAGAALAREVVENSVWARAWGCCTAGDEQVWPSDIQELAGILKRVDVLDGPAELSTMFSSGENVHLQRLDPPMFSVGKSGCVVQVLPSALRFWEKLGLTPHGGKRDVVAFVFLEDGGLEKQHQAEVWLNKMSVGYSAKQLGSFIPGSSTMCSADGVLPLRLENLRKSIRSFLQCLESSNDLVFFIAIPDLAIGLASPLLREIFSFVKQTQVKRSEAPILFQFVPEHLISSAESPSGEDSEIDALCYATYRRMLKPVERSMARGFPDKTETVAYFQEQPFVLARPSSTVHFAQTTPARSLDVMDRHTLLHVGYRFSACGKWLFAACVDQRGETYDLGTWLIQDEIETSAVVQVWNFAVQFAKRANVEWRIVIAKLGSMAVSELEGWNVHLAAAVPLCNDLPPFHVSLLSVEQNLCWPIIPQLNETSASTSSRRAPAKDSKSIYVDTAAPTYTIYPSTRIPLASRSCQEQLDSPFIPDNDGTTTSDSSSILPISTSILVRSLSTHTASTQSSIYIHHLHALHSPGSSLTISDDTMRKDITVNFYELSILAGAMLGFQEYPLLPFHLAALEAMNHSLRREDTS
ncbi:mediator complex subunit 13 C-terminal-domain-containing protein [Suillus clintonianus]|uniref:mediator complex subunit 13 C-terminal-domain-containing protein n=1 Tax=Suillus clintonianus TaxID=1904413 RepID=UPI001B883259|nr:mediator complex subunit 13 C-terminal-domain-containing protein [Suillus clintonianus]KAG2147926.1 mediator complex subunit 13 C-terminal-domain-containing protein [Suillus clintonianus]